MCLCVHMLIHLHARSRVHCTRVHTYVKMRESPDLLESSQRPGPSPPTPATAAGLAGPGQREEEKRPLLSEINAHRAAHSVSRGQCPRGRAGAPCSVSRWLWCPPECHSPRPSEGFTAARRSLPARPRHPSRPPGASGTVNHADFPPCHRLCREEREP